MVQVVIEDSGLVAQVSQGGRDLHLCRGVCRFVPGLRPHWGVPRVWIVVLGALRFHLAGSVDRGLGCGVFLGLLGSLVGSVGELGFRVLDVAAGVSASWRCSGLDFACMIYDLRYILGVGGVG